MLTQNLNLLLNVFKSRQDTSRITSGFSYYAQDIKYYFEKPEFFRNPQLFLKGKRFWIQLYITSVAKQFLKWFPFSHWGIPESISLNLFAYQEHIKISQISVLLPSQLCQHQSSTIIPVPWKIVIFFCNSNHHLPKFQEKKTETLGTSFAATHQQIRLVK